MSADPGLYDPWPCRFCGKEVAFPSVVCQQSTCRTKLEGAYEEDARMRDKIGPDLMGPE